MKTIDLTPTWEQWFRTATVCIVHGIDPVSQFNLLKPDFEKMAKIAAATVAEVEKNEKRYEQIELSSDRKTVEMIKDGDPVDLLNLVEAIIWQVNPYLEYGEETVRDEHIHIYELCKTYKAVTGIDLFNQ